MKYSYKTEGVCSSEIIIELENDVVKNIQFIGGCNGNAQGIAALVKGMNKQEVIQKLQDIKCGFRSTSCPAQLSHALQNIK